jgi:hypothetical protein
MAGPSGWPSTKENTSTDTRAGNVKNLAMAKVIGWGARP